MKKKVILCLSVPAQLRNTAVFCSCFIVFFMLANVVNAAGWEKKTAPIMTTWGENIDPLHVWEEYPRPQQERSEWMNLNGIWDFTVGINGGIYNKLRTYDQKILVPFPVESALSGIMDKNNQNADKNYWYRRTFTIPETYKGKDILLHFGAVDWRCEVYLNGTKVGIHEGGYDSFSFNITEHLTGSGEQELSLFVFDSQWAGGHPHGKQSLNPNGIWYTPVTGIWQTVWLEPVSDTHIEDFTIVPDIDNKLVKITPVVAKAQDDLSLSVRIFDGGKQVAEKALKLDKETAIALTDVKLWDPSSPFLYDMELVLKKGDEVVDRVKSYFGMRKVALGKYKEKPCIYLNNQPVFQYGILDQGWWPDGLYTAPCDEALKFDLEKIKAFGFNMVRKHVKTEPARWYYHCDKLGLLVWQDIPNATTNTNRNDWVETNFIREMKNIITCLKNAPSIITWVVFNEGWGQYDRDNQVQYREPYTRKAVQEAINLDNTRIIDGASGWFDYEIGDVIDKHIYPTPGVHPNPVNHRASVCGEYGGINLKIDNHIWAGSEVHYTTVENAEELTKLFINYANTVKLLKADGLCGAVYTQVTDVESEINGLITYDRKVVKLNEEQIERIRQVITDCIEKEYSIVLPTSKDEGFTWKYLPKISAPGNWYTDAFDDSSWSTGLGGFGAGNPPNSNVRTNWDSSTIYLRRNFQLGNLSKEAIDNLKLQVYYDEGCTVYINGVRAAATSGYVQNYVPIEINREAKDALKLNDTNLIAVRCIQTSGGQYIDVGLITEIVGNQTGVSRPHTTVPYRICPNPASDYFQLVGNADCNTELIDSGGKIVRRYPKETRNCDINGLSEGVYYVKINTQERIYTLELLIK